MPVVSLTDYRERRAAAADDAAALVASYVADYRAGASATTPETAALWLLADALEDLSDATPEQQRAVAHVLHTELARRLR